MASPPRLFFTHPRPAACGRARLGEASSRGKLASSRQGIGMAFDEGCKREGAPEHSAKIGEGALACVEGNWPGWSRLRAVSCSK